MDPSTLLHGKRCFLGHQAEHYSVLPTWGCQKLRRGWEGIRGGKTLGEDGEGEPGDTESFWVRLSPCGSAHPLPDLVLGPQVGRACLESPKVLPYIVHLGGVEAEGDA